MLAVARRSMNPIVQVSAFVAASFLSSCASSSDLGPFSGYYRYDCIGARGPRRVYAHQTLQRALAGEHAALHAVFTDRATFGTGDNEAWSELPGIFLSALGDDLYAAFVVSQPKAVQSAALFLSPEQIPHFTRTYPKTAKLFYARSQRNNRNG
jgi:hypothetical protein